MITQYDQRGFHQFPQDIGSITSRQVLVNRPPNNIVWIDTGCSRLSPDPNHQVPMPRTGIKLDGFGAELLVDRINQLSGFFGFDVTSCGVLHDHVRPQLLDLRLLASFALGGIRPERHHTTPKHDVMLSNRDTQASRLKRGWNLIKLTWVIAQDRQLCDVAPGCGAIDKNPHQAKLSLTGPRIALGGGC